MFNWKKKPPRTNYLRGWHIYHSAFHGREHWVAKRSGVGMNHSTYEGLVSMILSRPY